MSSQDFSKLHQTLGRIEGTQESILVRLDKMNGSFVKHVEDNNTTFYRLDDRIDQNSNKISYMNGKAAGIGGLSAGVVLGIIELIKKFT